MTIETTRDLFEHELQELYYVEIGLGDELTTIMNDANVDALDDIQQAHCRDELHAALDEHRRETIDQIERLEGVFEALDSTPEPKELAMFDRWVDENERFDNIVLNDELRPPFYLGAAMTVERMEIALYEGLLRLANPLDLSETVTNPLETTLQGERDALDRLETIAESNALANLLVASTERSKKFSFRDDGL